MSASLEPFDALAPPANFYNPPSLLELFFYTDVVAHARKRLEAAYAGSSRTGVSVG